MAKKIVLSLKGILTLIYMRTVLEIVVDYDDNGNIVNHKLTPVGMRCYSYIVNMERNAYRINKELYMKAVEISKIAYPKSKENFEDYTIYLEPLVYGLYFSQEKAMKDMLVLPGVFNDLFDDYYRSHDCDLEIESVKPLEFIWKETEKVIFEMKKEEKRK